MTATYDTRFIPRATRHSLARRPTTFFSERRLSATEYRDCHVLPVRSVPGDWRVYGGVVEAGGTFVDSSSIEEGVGAAYDFDPATAEALDGTAIYVGMLMENGWGHVITDDMKKLWFLHTDEGRRLLREGAQVVYTPRFGHGLATHTLAMLKLGGGIRLTEIKTVTRCRRLVIPDNSLILDNGLRWWTREYQATVERIKRGVAERYRCSEPETFEKIYFTRTQLGDWRDHGEESVERLFRESGFKVFAPERLTPEYQVWLMMHCREFATMTGSPAHTAMFCRPGTRLIDVRKAEYWNRYQDVVNDMANLSVTLLHAHASATALRGREWFGPFYVYPTTEVLRFFRKPLWQWRPCFLRRSWLAYRYKDSLHALLHRLLRR